MRKPVQTVRNKFDQIKRDYFLWLCKWIDTDESDEDTGNRELAWWLHQKEFSAAIPNDDNRASDGVKLREDFADEYLNREDCPCLDGPCTILEMLIALSKRMAFQISTGPGDNPVGKCFWEIIGNLGLTPIDPFHPYLQDKLYEMEQKVDIFIERKYHRDGYGGLFPLHSKGTKDQRVTEIWYQMMAYLKEKN